MTQKEKGIILKELKSAAKHYMDQELQLQEYMATNPQFPMTTQAYQRSQGRFLALKDLCYKLGINGTDIVEMILEE